jgi:hypothetical protein
MGRTPRPLTRYLATRVVGLAALGGLGALGAGLFGTDAASGAGGTGGAGGNSGTVAVTKTVSFSFNLRIALPKAFATSVRARGQADFAHHTAQATVDVPTVGLRGSASSAAGLIPDHAPLQVRTEWVDGHAYMAVPSSLSTLAGGATSLSLPVSSSAAGKINFDLTQSAVAITYAKVLLGELAPAKARRQVGHRTINGVAASGTEVDLTLAQLLKVIPGLTPAMTADAPMFSQATIPVTIWVDHEGRLVEVAMAPTTTTNDSVASISGTVRFSNYNAPVTVTAPPSASTKPMPAVIRQLLAGLYSF